MRGGLLRGYKEGNVPEGLLVALSRAFISLCFVSLEEILKTHIAHWWSPDGMQLAYATINDSHVQIMELPTYHGSVYPTTKPYHCHKIGRKPRWAASAYIHRLPYLAGSPPPCGAVILPCAVSKAVNRGRINDVPLHCIKFPSLQT